MRDFLFFLYYGMLFLAAALVLSHNYALDTLHTLGMCVIFIAVAQLLLDTCDAYFSSVFREAFAPGPFVALLAPHWLWTLFILFMGSALFYGWCQSASNWAAAAAAPAPAAGWRLFWN